MTHDLGDFLLITAFVLLVQSHATDVPVQVVLYLYSSFYFLFLIYFVFSLILEDYPPVWYVYYGIFVVIVVFTYAGIYSQHGILLDTDKGTETVHSFVDSLYFSIVTWTTLGYGDFSPTKDLRLIAAIEALLGFLYMGLFVGVIAGTIVRRR